MPTTRPAHATAVAEGLARVAVSAFPGTPLGPAMSQVVKRLLVEEALDGRQAAELWRAIGFVQLPELYAPAYDERVVGELAQGIERGAASLRVGDLRALGQALGRLCSRGACPATDSK